MTSQEVSEEQLDTVGLHEELRSVGVLSAVRHRQQKWLLVLNRELLIWKLWEID